MRKIILTFGLISGAIVSAMLLITQPLLRDGTLDTDNSVFVGFAAMVIALSLIFVGIKSFRDQHLNGSITFGKGFKVGILIALVASVCYAVTWEVYYNTVGSDFLEWYQQCQIDKMVKEGANESELVKAKADMEQLGKLYQNPLIRFGMTLMEIFPVGLIITVLSSALLRKKEILPA